MKNIKQYQNQILVLIKVLETQGSGIIFEVLRRQFAMTTDKLVPAARNMFLHPAVHNLKT